MRFPLEVFEEVVKVSNNLPIGMRITGTEWEENGIEIEDALVFSKQLKNLGCNYVCVSSAGNTHKPNIAVKPHYQVHLSENIKKNVDAKVHYPVPIHLQPAAKFLKYKSPV